MVKNVIQEEDILLQDEDLVNLLTFQNMGGKMIKLILKWVPTPKENKEERRVPMQKEIQKLLNIDKYFTLKGIKVQEKESIIRCEGKGKYLFVLNAEEGQKLSIRIMEEENFYTR